LVSGFTGNYDDLSNGIFLTFEAMKPLLILVPRITNRLRYAFQLMIGKQLGISYELTTDRERFETYEGPAFSYGEEPVGQLLFFKASALLFDREIVQQELKPVDFEGVKGLFAVYHRQSAAPFDLFAAAFYLVSRYEEYLPFVPDNHGRFQASSSCLSALGLLQKPLVNIWAGWLGNFLEAHFPTLKAHKPVYSFQPTYDIDLAWAYKNKGLYRSLGAYARDLLAADFDQIQLRTKVLKGKQTDPYDTYDLQLQLQKEFALQPVYFILFSAYGRYDKNISVRNPAFHSLIRQLADYADVGIHPSYASSDDKSLLKSEMDALSEVLKRDVNSSRMHFLRMKLPMTYHQLIDLGITDDYTMGYAAQPGFRAGIANPFTFYDLDHDVPTNLTVHPIMLMDGTLRDYLNLEPEAAIELSLKLINEVKNCGGKFVSLWHNETLSNSKRWEGWNAVYYQIIREASS